MMRNFFTQPQKVVPQAPRNDIDPIVSTSGRVAGTPSALIDGVLTQCGYLSDIMTDSESDTDHGIEAGTHIGLDVRTHSVPVESALMGRLPAVHPLKRCKLDVPARTQCMASTAEQYNTQAKALEEIEKLLKLKKTEFLGGPHGLQAKQA